MTPVQTRVTRHRGVVMGSAARTARVLGLVVALLAMTTPGVVRAAAPANDDFANAQVITTLPLQVGSVTTDATTEVGEPAPSCSNNVIYRTVWYEYTPAHDEKVRLVERPNLQSMAIYRDTGTGLAGLQLIDCVAFNDTELTSLSSGAAYAIQVGQAVDVDRDMTFSMSLLVPPANDDFANATNIASLPFSESEDASGATVESGEPSGCLFGTLTVWYVYVADHDGWVTAYAKGGYGSAHAVYTGASPGGLTEIGCGGDGPLTFQVHAGTTYHIRVSLQVFGYDFSLSVTPPMEVIIGTGPPDPSRLDVTTFGVGVNDPGGGQIIDWAWSLGDGTTSTIDRPMHQYARDGDYEVSVAIRMADGRTGSSQRLISVRTHDVGVASVRGPSHARVGQTRGIVVKLRDRHYPEFVLVTLFRSTSAGDVQIGQTNMTLPVRTGSRTIRVVFPYTFTADDAQAGRIRFTALVNVLGARDAVPANDVKLSRSTRVSL